MEKHLQVWAQMGECRSKGKVGRHECSTNSTAEREITPSPL